MKLEVGSLVAGMLPAFLANKLGVSRLVGQVIRGEAPPTVVKGLEFVASVLPNDAARSAIVATAEEQGYDLPALIESSLPYAEAAVGVETSGEWHQRATLLIRALIDNQQPTPSVRAVVTCPNCKFIHGV